VLCSQLARETDELKFIRCFTNRSGNTQCAVLTTCAKKMAPEESSDKDLTVELGHDAQKNIGG
jgi:hypothetical protein